MANAYLQLPLDDDRVQTINTHKGLLMYTYVSGFP